MEHKALQSGRGWVALENNKYNMENYKESHCNHNFSDCSGFFVVKKFGEYC